MWLGLSVAYADRPFSSYPKERWKLSLLARRLRPLHRGYLQHPGGKERQVCVEHPHCIAD